MCNILRNLEALTFTILKLDNEVADSIKSNGRKLLALDDRSKIQYHLLFDKYNECLLKSISLKSTCTKSPSFNIESSFL